MQKNRKAEALSAGVCLALGMLISCATSANVAPVVQEKATPVGVVEVKRQDLGRDLELSAEFRPQQEVAIYAKVSGYLKAIYVDVGDRVKKGQLIAELEVPEMAQDVSQAAAALKRAELEVERARSEVRRMENARRIKEISYNRLAAVMKARPNLIAQQEIDDAAARLQDAESQLQAAQATLAVTEEQVRIARANKARIDTLAGYLRMTAPFSGVVTQRLGDPGAMIQAGTTSHIQALPIVRISAIDRLRFVLPVPASIAGRIRVGTPVEIRVDSLNRIFHGRISRFSGALDASTRTMLAEVDLPNTDQALMPGMYGYARLRFERRDDVLAVPIQAVSGHGVGASVWLVNSENRLEERKVDTGMQTPDMIEILSGLAEGDRVVVGNRNRLRAGLLVDPKPLAGSQRAKAEAVH